MEKTNFWKKYVLNWKGECFQHFQCCKRNTLIWKDTEEIHFCKIFKSSKTFSNSDEVEGTLDLVHRKAFLLKYLFIAPVIVRHALLGFFIDNVTIINISLDKSFIYSKKWRSWNETLKFAWQIYDSIYFTKYWS